jgi:selT/selW/selH-like putative selenoprotein
MFKYLLLRRRGAFMQVKQLVEQRFPGIKVIGSNYPVAALKQTLAQIVGAAQMGALGFVFFGPQIFAAMGQPQPPDWYQQVATNKFGVAIGVWFMGNLLVNKLTSTGAFEIYTNGELVSDGRGC